MAQGFYPQPSDGQRYADIVASARAVTGIDLTRAMTGDGYASIFSTIPINWNITTLVNQIVYGNNTRDITNEILYDQLDYLSAIYNKDSAAGAVDLTLTNEYLASIQYWLATISADVRGGQDVDFTSIVSVLDNRLYDVAQQLFVMNQTGGVNLSPLVLALTAGVEGTFGNAVDVHLRQLNQLITLLIQIIANASGQVDPNTIKVAEATEAAPALDAVLSSMLSQLSNPDADEYANWIVNSGPFALMAGARAAWPAIRAILTAAFGTTIGQAGLVALDQRFNDGNITTAVTDSALWAIGRGADFISKLASKVIGIAGEVTRASQPAFDQFFTPIFRELIDETRNTVEALGEVGPNDGFSNAVTFLTRAAQLGLHAHHNATAMEMIPFAHHFGLHQVTAFMADMAGFGAMSSQTLGKAIGESVGRAAGYEINARTRSKLPSESQLSNFVLERVMTPEEQATLLAFQGYSDRWIEMIQREQWRDPTLTQIIRLANDVSVTDADVTNWLQQAGFDDNDVAKITPIVMEQSRRSERSALLSEVMSNLREGFITNDDAEYYFDRLRLSPASREYLRLAAALGFRRNLMQDALAGLKSQVTGGLMDASEFALAAESQGINANRVAIEASNLEVKRLAKVAATENAEHKTEVRKQQTLLVQKMRAAYQYGLIDAASFELAMIQGGIDAGVARATVELEQVKLVGRVGAARAAEAARLSAAEIDARERAFVELFRKGVIDGAELQDSLVALGLTVGLADAIVQREQARVIGAAGTLATKAAALKAKELVTLGKTTLQVNFRKGLITSNDYLQGLIYLGVDAAIAQSTVNLEVARRQQEQLPPEAPDLDTAAAAAARRSMAALVQAYADAKISESTLRGELVRLGAKGVLLDALVQEAIEKRTLKETPKGAEV